MKPKPRPITLEILAQHLRYEPKSGKFFWLHSLFRPDLEDREAGSVDRSGYIRIKIGKQPYYAHRLAYLFMVGVYPTKYVDHKDGDRQNNRWDNLRLATHGQNASNSTGWAGRSLPKGVYKSSTSRNYFAVILVDRVRHHLGTFKCPDQARAAYLSAAVKFKGEFAR